MGRKTEHNTTERTSLWKEIKMDNNRPEDIAARARLNEAAAEIERDAAVDVAASNAVSADYANAQAVDATIEANRARAAAAEIATDRSVLRNELAYERAASENNAFGFYLTLGILVAGLLVTGIYLYWRNSTPDVSVYAASPSVSAPANPPVIVTPSASPAPAPAPPPVVNVTPPAQQPPVVNVNPATPPAPNVHNDIHVTPPANSGAGGGTGTDAGTSGTDTGSSGSTGTGGG
jgi:hypothetical protein